MSYGSALRYDIGVGLGLRAKVREVIRPAARRDRIDNFVAHA